MVKEPPKWSASATPRWQGFGPGLNWNHQPETHGKKCKTLQNVSKTLSDAGENHIQSTLWTIGCFGVFSRCFGPPYKPSIHPLGLEPRQRFAAELCRVHPGGPPGQLFMCMLQSSMRFLPQQLSIQSLVTETWLFFCQVSMGLNAGQRTRSRKQRQSKSICKDTGKQQKQGNVFSALSTPFHGCLNCFRFFFEGNLGW